MRHTATFWPHASILQRPITVTEPCVGVGGLRELCARSGIPYCLDNSFDVVESLGMFCRKRRADAGLGTSSKGPLAVMR